MTHTKTPNEHWATPDPRAVHEPPKFPGFRFGPNGESAVFQSEEQVPEGWTDNPNDFKELPQAVIDSTQPPAPALVDVAPEGDLGREDVLAKLIENHVDYSPRWPTSKLNTVWRDWQKDNPAK